MNAFRNSLWSDEYRRWLKDKIHAPKEYTILLTLLNNMPFEYFLGNDEDRSKDGLELRYSFMQEHNLINTDHIYDAVRTPCTFLEMCIGLSERMNMILYRPMQGSRAHLFFWEIMDNLGFSGFTDSVILNDQGLKDVIAEAVERVNLREFKYDGRGGLFPLDGPCEDQRKVEIWYQMSEYINRKYIDYDFLRKT